jgi:hypothetical protein
MRGGFAFSIGVHALILALILFGLPFLRVKPPEPMPMISVDLIEMGKETTTNQISAANKVEKEPQEETPPPPPKPPEAVEPTPTPQPEPQPPAPRPPLDTSVPEIAPEPDALSELKVPEVSLKKPLKPAPELAPIDQKIEPLDVPAKIDLKRPQPKPTPESFDAVLKNLSKLKPQEATTQPPSPDVKAPVKPVTGAQAPVSANLTASEMDALKQQLRQCWNLPAAAKNAKDLVVDLDVMVNPDRTVQTVEIVDKSRMASDSEYRAAAESARRALRNPLCTPLALPPEKYKEWQSMTLHFDPKEMLGQ